MTPERQAAKRRMEDYLRQALAIGNTYGLTILVTPQGAVVMADEHLTEVHLIGDGSMLEGGDGRSTRAGDSGRTQEVSKVGKGATGPELKTVQGVESDC
jgi:hypothetical protein